MAAIQVSLVEALSPEPAKVAALKRSPLAEADRGFPASWEDSEPLKVLSPSASNVPQLPGQVATPVDVLPDVLQAFREETLCANAVAPREIAAGPRKVALPAEALGTPSTGLSSAFESVEGEDRFWMGSGPQLPSSPLPQPVRLAEMLEEDGGLEREVIARETVMRLGLATPCKVRSCSDGLPLGEALKTAAFLFDAETTTGIATPCSSPDRQSVTGSPSCSDQETMRTSSKCLPNPGSALHVKGSCHPCAWFWKSIGCSSGAECSFCHLCPDGVLKARKKAKQVMKRMGHASPKAQGQQPKTALSLSCLV